MDFLTHLTSPVVIELIGISGFILYVLNYALLTFCVLDAKHAAYFAINLTAASFVLIGLTASFNLASAMIQIFWIVISLIAITIRLSGHLGRRSRTNAPQRAGY